MDASRKKNFKPALIALAPLAGISSLPFRSLNREFGCKFAFSEMISARSLSYSSKRTLRMMLSNPSDRPLGVQLLGEKSEYIMKALERLTDYDYDVLDFNAACPQKKVTSHGKGAALLREPKKLKSLVSLMVKESSRPVTVKMRLGWDSEKNAVDIAKCIEDAGADAVCVHGRTRIQGYKGSVNYSAIEKVKESVNIPVIASGDILSPLLAKKMFDETKCDAVIVARGSLGNPWIFKAIDGFLTDGIMPEPPGLSEITRVMKYHLKLCVDFYGEKPGVARFKKFFIWYTRGFPNVKHLRNKVTGVWSAREISALIDIFNSSENR